MVDLGTKSISDSFEKRLKPSRVLVIPKGLKRLGIFGILKIRKDFREMSKDAGCVLCLHHAALTLVALFMNRRKGVRYVAVTDWTRAFPSLRTGLYIRIYNFLYARLANRFDGVFSPSPSLREYYGKRGLHFNEILIPLPFDDGSDDSHVESPLRYLFIGATYRRKAGDVLLNIWADSAPPNAELTFVCPNPPDVDCKGVTFLKDIKANTPEHRRLFDTHSVFLLPTRRDAYGFAALEAINLCRCVVVTKGAGIASLVEEAGGIVGDDPEDAIRRAIQLASNPDEIRTRKEKCRDFIPAYRKRVDEALEKMIRS